VGLVRFGKVFCYLSFAYSRFLASNLAVPSCIVDDRVNIALPLENVSSSQTPLKSSVPTL
jgi:hypothetical protein